MCTLGAFSSLAEVAIAVNLAFGLLRQVREAFSAAFHAEFDNAYEPLKEQTETDGETLRPEFHTIASELSLTKSNYEEASKEGVKRIVPYAIGVTLANVLLLVVAPLIESDFGLWGSLVAGVSILAVGSFPIAWSCIIQAGARTEGLRDLRVKRGMLQRQLSTLKIVATDPHGSGSPLPPPPPGFRKDAPNA
jgi:hypothetical protein